ncbi:6-carboxytetrahydropterin synthase QueD [Heliobacterium gestii]|uniref:6-carboxy-5,6,7,8-tetrahydropterin synthase n=1 Tax=Heliomicrobium gestii TaxID=2699 RepID=A0A845LA82_HELGE|nr:6-carboxytetrahydropterin synthase QueD [Heliomicrobium gestii]MBM7865318.1 6-pyruvoyltetrahydropterin/6-carboxytetrahydropterin synthase [Heliomicrobium gestii]MZP41579.1 6-carboxytetrahydropterin synthase QueD [Heliomicrobium gestii]
MYELIVQTHFDAAHFLRDYPGDCARVHGHTWQVEVTLMGRELDDLGMLIDFKEVKKAVKAICDQLDHRMINEHDYFQHRNPTAENLSCYFFHELAGWLKANHPHVRVATVRIWESPRASICYRADDDLSA